MRVLLIAGFSNDEVRRHMVFNSHARLFNGLIRLFGLPQHVGKFSDHAPWVSNMIKDLEKRGDIELHVAGPHIRLKRAIEEFEIRDVSYHFFRAEISSFFRLVGNYKVWKKLQRSCHYMKKILEKVEPDIVVLSGAENPTTSISILAANNYPRLCLCQTVYNDDNLDGFFKRDKLHMDLERDIISSLDHVGVYSKKHYLLIRGLGYKKNIYRFSYPTPFLQENPSIEKKYDFVNYAANHGSVKGTQDSIKAMALLKDEKPNVTLNIVGKVDEQLMVELKSLIDQYSLQKNVFFTPAFENRDELLEHIQQSHYAVLPCKNDFISGTTVESMMLGIPAVVYKTAGTPSLNNEKECVLIAENGDVNDLANKMASLINCQDKAVTIRENGKWYMKKWIDNNNKNWDKMVNCFSYIIEQYQTGKQVPVEMLFDEKEDF